MASQVGTKGARMTQPPGAPPEQWVQRRDHVSRVVIDRIDNLAAEMKRFVTWERLSVILGVSAVVIVGAAWVVTLMAAQSALGAAQEARVEMVQTRAAIAEDVRQVRAESAAAAIQVRSETADRLNRFENKLDAVLGVVVEGKPRSEAARELKETEK